MREDLASAPHAPGKQSGPGPSSENGAFVSPTMASGDPNRTAHSDIPTLHNHHVQLFPCSAKFSHRGGAECQVSSAGFHVFMIPQPSPPHPPKSCHCLEGRINLLSPIILNSLNPSICLNQKRNKVSLGQLRPAKLLSLEGREAV